MSGGAGGDWFRYVDYNTGNDTFTGGTGQDTYELLWNNTHHLTSEITDFTTGASGDVIDLSGR